MCLTKRALYYLPVAKPALFFFWTPKPATDPSFPQATGTGACGGPL